MKKFILQLLIASSIISSCTPSSLKKDESTADIIIDQPPLPPKGMDAFLRYIGDRFNYSKAMMDHQVAGLIEISFVVEQDGSISNLKVEKDLGYGTGEEGIRVIKDYGKWTPGYQKGKPVRVSYILPIRLNPPKKP